MSLGEKAGEHGGQRSEHEAIVQLGDDAPDIMGARAVLGKPLDDDVHARRHRPEALDGLLRVDLPHQPHGVSALKQDEVMARHHAGEAAVGDDAQVMDPPPRHLEEGIESPPGRVDGQERLRHHVSHGGGRREAAGNHLGAQIAIGHDADRSAVVPSRARRHRARRARCHRGSRPPGRWRAAAGAGPRPIARRANNGLAR